MKEITIIGQAEQGAIDQARNCMVDAEYFCLMADNHKGYGMPVGGVAVYKNKVSPAGVGFDIACGNEAIRLNLDYGDIKDELPRFADLIWDRISFGVGRKNQTPVSHNLFRDSAWNEVEFFRDRPELKLKAEGQLGTVGSGNHYIDVFKDENNKVWVGVHFGSRGFGHTIASHFMQLAGDNPNIMDETPHLLSLDTKDGQDYFRAMELAGRYAYAGRDWVCETVAEVLGGNTVDYVHNHHNFAWREEHFGEQYIVVRKGATPAFPGQYGFIGGSMGENAVIVRGVDSEMSKNLFYSTVHGAGRVMSRTQAAGKFKGWGEKRRQVSHGLVNFEVVKQDLKAKGIELRGAGADEAPQVYKRLPEVLDYHAETIEVVHTLTPLIVCMAGSDEYDPYKD